MDILFLSKRPASIGILHPHIAFSQVEALSDYGINSAKEIPEKLLECELEEDTQNDKNSCS